MELEWNHGRMLEILKPWAQKGLLESPPGSPAIIIHTLTEMTKKLLVVIGKERPEKRVKSKLKTIICRKKICTMKERGGFISWLVGDSDNFFGDILFKIHEVCTGSWSIVNSSFGREEVVLKIYFQEGKENSDIENMLMKITPGWGAFIPHYDRKVEIRNGIVYESK